MAEHQYGDTFPFLEASNVAKAALARNFSWQMLEDAGVVSCYVIGQLSRSGLRAAEPAIVGETAPAHDIWPEVIEFCELHESQGVQAAIAPFSLISLGLAVWDLIRIILQNR